MTNKTNVNSWIKNRTPHQVKALENASKIFDEEDSLTVNSLEAIYGQETSFGDKNFLGTRNSTKPSGHFQQKKDSAIEQGLKVDKNNDERFDIDTASIGAAKQLKQIDNIFRNGARIIGKLHAIAVLDGNERLKFTLAAYNNGQTRIARAQNFAKQDGKSETKWQDVQNYLAAAGASEAQIKEVLEYVEKILAYEKEFSEKSKANKKLKDKDPKKVSNDSGDGHWVTLDSGNHVFIEDKNSSRK